MRVRTPKISPQLGNHRDKVKNFRTVGNFEVEVAEDTVAITKMKGIKS